MRQYLKTGFAAVALCFGIGLSGAEASVNRPLPNPLATEPAVTPAAMCGYRCFRGGFYIPGPPGVCYARGLNYCGPSRPWAGPPGYGFYGPRRHWGRPYGGPRFYGPYGGWRY